MKFLWLLEGIQWQIGNYPITPKAALMASTTLLTKVHYTNHSQTVGMLEINKLLQMASGRTSQRQIASSSLSSKSKRRSEFKSSIGSSHSSTQTLTCRRSCSRELRTVYRTSKITSTLQSPYMQTIWNKSRKKLLVILR